MLMCQHVRTVSNDPVCCIQKISDPTASDIPESYSILSAIKGGVRPEECLFCPLIYIKEINL